MRLFSEFRRSLILIVAILLGTFSSQQAFASHYAAVDISATYIGAGQDGCTGTTDYTYQVVLQIYAVCASGSSSLGQFENLTVSSASLGFSQNIQLDSGNHAIYPDSLTIDADTVDQLCPTFSAINSCRVNANDKYPGYARVTYKLTMKLPGPAPDWVFSWSSGARGNTITNLANPGSLNIYVECGLDNTGTHYNTSTPRYTEVPFPYICVNQPATYLNGPYDIANDSMDTYAQNALNFSATSLCPYNPGYSASDPVGSLASNPYRVDKLTGTTTFTPPNTGKFVLSFRTDAYDRKTQQRIAYTMRDATVSIFDCTTPPPPIDSIPLNTQNSTYVKGKKSILVCPGSNMSFDVTAQSTSPSAQIYMSSNTATVLPAGNFTTSGDGTSTVNGTFTWTPTTADYGEHTLIVTAKDSTCTGTGFSIVLKSYQVVLIRVVNGLDAGPDLPVCSINNEARQLSVLGADGLSIQWASIQGDDVNSSLSCTTCTNPLAKVHQTTVYTVHTDDLAGTCKNTDTVSVYIDTTNTLDAFPDNPMVMCRPDYLQLSATLTGEGPLTNLACAPYASFNPLCANYDSAAIYGTPLFGRIAYDTATGAPVLNNIVRSTKQQFLIQKGDFRATGIRSAILRSITFETAHNGDPAFAYNNFKISVKCTPKSALSASTGFESNMTLVYAAPGPITFADGVHTFKFDTPYQLDTNQNLIIEICYGGNSYYAGSCVNPTTPQPPVMKYSPTTYISSLSYFPTKTLFINGKVTTIPDTNIVDVCGVLGAGNISERSLRPAFSFTYCDAPSAPFDVKWTPGTLLSDSTILQPLAYVPKSIKYVVETHGKSACVLRDSVDIYVPIHHFQVGPIDTSICLGTTAPLFIKNGFAYIWHEFEGGQFIPATSLSCTDCANPFATPKHTTTYKVEVSDSVFCFDTLTVTINVLPLPKVHILNNDTIVKYGQPFQLLVNGARTYNWQPVSSLNNPNISYPIATPTEPTQYIVEGLNAQGCRSYDTVNVGIDYRNRLFIPNAFSPNGDGKNDVFKVPNLTFERIMEFRVFNRWGQEIFSTTDSKQGWDGTWKGTPQDVGTYSYLIKVGYPDGLEETYKGSVTLIR